MKFHVAIQNNSSDVKLLYINTHDYLKQIKLADISVFFYKFSFNSITVEMIKYFLITEIDYLEA